MSTIHDVPFEERVNRAVLAVQSGQPITKTAKACHISYSMLQRRLAGIASELQSYASRQILSPAKESELVEWIQEMCNSGYPQSAGVVKAMASTMTDQT